MVSGPEMGPRSVIVRQHCRGEMLLFGVYNVNVFVGEFHASVSFDS